MPNPESIQKIKNENFLKEYKELTEKHGLQLVPQLIPHPVVVPGPGGQDVVWTNKIVTTIGPIESKIATPNKKVAPKVEIKK